MLGVVLRHSTPNALLLPAAVTLHTLAAVNGGLHLEQTLCTGIAGSCSGSQLVN